MLSSFFSRFQLSHYLTSGLGHFVSRMLMFQTPKQIALALALGVLLSFGSVISWSVLIVFCIFRINTAWLALGWLLGESVLLLFSPMLDGLGYAVLSAPAFREVFTVAYNSAFWRMTGFNDTVTMGGMLVSLMLSLLVYVFAIKNFTKHQNYHERLIAWIRNQLIRFKLDWLIALHSEGSDKKRFSKKGTTVLLGGAGILMLCYVVLGSVLIERQLEHQMSKFLGTQVNIGDANFNLFKGSIGLEEVSIQSPDNPLKNSIEWHELSAEISWYHWIANRFVLEAVTIEGVRFDTLSDNNKKQPQNDSETVASESDGNNLAKNWLDDYAPELPSGSALAQELTHPLVSDEQKKKLLDLTKRTEFDYKQLNAKLPNIDIYRERIARIRQVDLSSEQQLKALQKQLASLKSDFTKDRKAIDDIQRFKTSREGSFQHLLNGIHKSAESEVSRLTKNNKLRLNAENALMNQVFGEDLAKHFNTVQQAYVIIQPLLASLKKQEEPDKLQDSWLSGRAIEFIEQDPQPAFNIKQLDFDFTAADRQWTGQGRNLNALAQSIELIIIEEAESPLVISGQVFNNTSEGVDSSWKINRSETVITDYALSSDSRLPLIMKEAQLAMGGVIKLNDKGIEGFVEWIFKAIRWQDAQTDNALTNQYLDQVQKSLNQMNVALSIGGFPNNYHLDLASSADKIFADAFQSAIVKGAQTALSQSIREQVELKQKAELQAIAPQLNRWKRQQAEWTESITRFNQLEQIQAQEEKALKQPSDKLAKEVTKKVERQGQDALEKGLKDLLK